MKYRKIPLLTLIKLSLGSKAFGDLKVDNVFPTTWLFCFFFLIVFLQALAVLLMNT